MLWNGVLVLGLFVAIIQLPTALTNMVKYTRFIEKTPSDETKLKLEGVIAKGYNYGLFLTQVSNRLQDKLTR